MILQELFVIICAVLSFYGMPTPSKIQAQGAPAFEAAMPMLADLLKVEIAEREVRSIAYHKGALPL